MLSYRSILVLLTALSTSLAAPQVTSFPGEQKCSPTTTITTTSSLTTPLTCECGLQTICASGQVLTTSPLPTTTLLEGCTLEVLVGPSDCGQECSFCTTTTPQADKRAGSSTEATVTSFPGHEVCSPTATITTTSTRVNPCACPIITPCSAGSTLTPSPLPTTTLLEGCVEEVVVGPGCSCPYCEAVAA